MPDFGDQVDKSIFESILEMDDDETEREFSKPLVFGFFDQAKDTFVEMDAAVKSQDLTVLSQKGHFLKGSSATLGFNKIRDSCQIIQQYGNRLNVDGTPEPDEAVCLQKIVDALTVVKSDTAKVEDLMKDFFTPKE